MDWFIRKLKYFFAFCWSIENCAHLRNIWALTLQLKWWKVWLNDIWFIWGFRLKLLHFPYIFLLHTSNQTWYVSNLDFRLFYCPFWFLLWFLPYQWFYTTLFRRVEIQPTISIRSCDDLIENTRELLDDIQQNYWKAREFPRELLKLIKEPTVNGIVLAEKVCFKYIWGTN